MGKDEVQMVYNEVFKVKNQIEYVCIVFQDLFVRILGFLLVDGVIFNDIKFVS